MYRLFPNEYLRRYICNSRQEDSSNGEILQVAACVNKDLLHFQPNTYSAILSTIIKLCGQTKYCEIFVFLFITFTLY